MNSVYRSAYRLGLTGDVMLGRLVDRYVLADPGRDPASVWGDTLELFGGVDARLINLECVIADAGVPDPSKVFCFRARPRAIEALQAARVTFAGAANNHVLDFGPDALEQSLGLLRSGGIAVAGAGRTIDEASAPALITAAGVPVAVVAITDNEPGWEAGEDRPGVNFVAYDDGGLRDPYRERLGAALRTARDRAAFVLVCAHVGPNWGPPSAGMRALAHQLLDLGADLYWGHSNHAVQGVEFHDDRPILYSCGDFLDDYAVDPLERNDLSCFVEVEVAGGRVDGLWLHPVRVDAFRVGRAGAEDARWLFRRLADRCAALGTAIHPDDDRGPRAVRVSRG